MLCKVPTLGYLAFIESIGGNMSAELLELKKAPLKKNVNLEPGTLRVVRRNGTITSFDPTRISLAITKTFWDVQGKGSEHSQSLKEIVQLLTQEVENKLMKRIPLEGGTVHIEDIQDQVELALARNGYSDIMRAYVLYREEHRKMREAKKASANDIGIMVSYDDGSKSHLDMDSLNQVVNEACYGLDFVEPQLIIKETLRNLFEGVPIRDVHKALIMSARTLIEKEPNYSCVAARLLLNDLQWEALSFLRLTIPSTRSEMKALYAEALKASLNQGVRQELLDAKLLSFDLDKLGQALDAAKDFQFSYLGLQTLYDRYFIHQEGIRYELPQVFFMRVAMGLAIQENNKEDRAIEFYHLLSSFDYMSSTPTLFNSGSTRSQLSSCYLTTVPDDLYEIYGAIRDNALLSKFAGGLGNDWTPVRSLNAHIKGTNGKSQGVVPFLKVANDTAVAVNQGGKRKGALCAYLEVWHLDIEEFLELRKNTGDDRRRTHDMNTANWIPDLFMKRVMENKDWTLFTPNEVPDLHDLYGDAFEIAYTQYEVLAAAGKMRNFKTIPAISLWRKMLSMLFETGHPWITFKDVCNLRSPQSHVGVIHSSNLCTEITLNTSVDEIAVCNLGSINLSQHVTANGLDKEKLAKTIKTAVRMLDNVIDINFYPVPQARRSNLRHRPIGLGIMGFQDALYKLDIPYESKEAIKFADESMELVSFYALSASNELAIERGTYSTFEGSLWSQGILPIDSIKRLQETRGIYLDQDQSQTLDWNSLRERIKTTGMRNSNVLAIAPTATISNICGVSQSIEPTYQNLFVKSNLSGEFTIVNPYLVTDLKAVGLWDDSMVKDLKYFNGSVSQIARIPQRLKDKYKTAFEIDPHCLVDCGSRRQKWIDQAQSLNLYMSAPNGKKLDALYRAAWLKGLKTTYYLRSLGATNAEKSTLHDGALNAVRIQPEIQTAMLCSIEDPTCESCQ
ncbi:MAG: nrdA [Francisellaceae bacterium]|nr:nrdA [Francisellaceae bacterium]